MKIYDTYIVGTGLKVSINNPLKLSSEDGTGPEDPEGGRGRGGGAREGFRTKVM